jgi:hypothetical protein
MKYLVFIFIISIAFCSKAQHFSITPFVGVKAEFGTGQGAQDEDYAYFKTYTPRIHTGISPVLLGFNFEFTKNKNLFSLGIVHGDQANSTIRLEYFEKYHSPYLNYQFLTKITNFAGYNVFKVPMLYKRELLSLNSKKHPGNQIISVKMQTGMNMLYLRTKGIPVLQNPIVHGASVTLLGDTLVPVTFSGHYNRSFSVSFNVGLDFDFYIKNQRRVNLQLYYEQGTYKIAQSAIALYKVNSAIPWSGFATTSRGSSIHFKLGFPIGLKT